MPRPREAFGVEGKELESWVLGPAVLGRRNGHVRGSEEMSSRPRRTATHRCRSFAMPDAAYLEPQAFGRISTTTGTSTTTHSSHVSWANWWLPTFVDSQDLLGPPRGRGSCDVTPFVGAVTRAARPDRESEADPASSRRCGERTRPRILVVARESFCSFCRFLA